LGPLGRWRRINATVNKCGNACKQIGINEAASGSSATVAVLANFRKIYREKAASNANMTKKKTYGRTKSDAFSSLDIVMVHTTLHAIKVIPKKMGPGPITGKVEQTSKTTTIVCAVASNKVTDMKACVPVEVTKRLTTAKTV